MNARKRIGPICMGERATFGRSVAQLVVALVFVAGPALAQLPVIPSDVKSAVQKVIDYGYCRGMVVGLLNTNGAACHVYGRLAYDDDRVPDENTLFYEYSNFGMGLLGHVLERITGRAHESLVIADIADELGLNDTRINLTAEQHARLGRGYRGVVELPNWDLGSMGAAGALKSSARNVLE